MTTNGSPIPSPHRPSSTFAFLVYCALPVGILVAASLALEIAYPDGAAVGRGTPAAVPKNVPKKISIDMNSAAALADNTDGKKGRVNGKKGGGKKAGREERKSEIQQVNAHGCVHWCFAPIPLFVLADTD